jgi:hypothetical protein
MCFKEMMRGSVLFSLKKQVFKNSLYSFGSAGGSLFGFFCLKM